MRTFANSKGLETAVNDEERQSAAGGHVCEWRVGAPRVGFATLAALKTVFTNVLQSPAPSSSSSSSSVPAGATHHRASSTGAALPQPTRVRLQLHPLDLLSRVSPLAFVQRVLVALLSGELERLRQSSAREMDLGRAVELAANGCLAFVLNVVSFTANKKVEAMFARHSLALFRVVLRPGHVSNQSPTRFGYGGRPRKRRRRRFSSSTTTTHRRSSITRCGGTFAVALSSSHLPTSAKTTQTSPSARSAPIRRNRH